MDKGSDGSRNRDCRGKEYRYQGNSQGIVLHPNFKGNRMLLLFSKSEQTRNDISQEETTEVVKEDHDDDEDTHIHNLSPVDGNDTAEDN